MTAAYEELANLGFFQAVRYLESFQKDRKPIADSDDPTRELLRFGVHNSFAFPCREVETIKAVRLSDGSLFPFLLTNILGLTGPQATLPTVYTEALLKSRKLQAICTRSGERVAAEAVFDIFNHRILSLFYQAWKKHRVAISIEDAMTDRKCKGTDSLDLVSVFLRTLVGVQQPEFTHEKAVSDDMHLYCAGLFARTSRSAVVLEQTINNLFMVGVHVQQFCGDWCLPGCNPTRNVGQRQTGTETLGYEAKVAASRVEIKIGPLTLESFVSFLPSGENYLRLKLLCRSFTMPGIAYDLKLVLLRKHVPKCRLDLTDTSSVQLGLSTWLGNGNHSGDRRSAKIMLSEPSS